MAGKRKYTLNESFFERIDSEEKAYWLGFICADGYVTGGKIVGIKLGEKDREHLEKFKLAIGTNIPTYSGTNFGKFSNQTSGTKWCSVVLTSKKLVSDLYNLGINSQKTQTLEYPTLAKELEHHFIRGYFDGDGSVFEGQRRLNINILGRYDFICEVSSRLTYTSKQVYRHKSIFALQLAGKTRCRKVFDIIYEDANIFLPRKKIKFEEYFRRLDEE